MKSKCVVCGREIERGITCDKCDRPRGSRATTLPGAAKTRSNVEPFPKAAVVPFPSEAVPLAMRSVWDVIIAARLPAVLLSANGSVKFISDEGRQLLELPTGQQIELATLQDRLGVGIESVQEPHSTDVEVDGREIEISFVPLAQGRDGTALLLREFVPLTPSNIASTEAVLPELKALREALTVAKRRKTDPLLEDTAAIIDRIVATLEMNQAPADLMPSRDAVTITEIIKEITSRLEAIAQLKGLRLQGDVPELHDVLSQPADIAHVLEIFLRNSFLYVPKGGQIFVGARTVQQKNKHLALFFVMDNGPTVPEALRKKIFTEGFEWSPQGTERTGRDLFQCQEIASEMGGQCWVEGKSGKSCTFFMTVLLRE